MKDSRTKRLMKTFTDEPYNKLKKVNRMGKSADVYTDNIKRLARLAGYVEKERDQMVKLAFVTCNKLSWQRICSTTKLPYWLMQPFLQLKIPWFLSSI